MAVSAGSGASDARAFPARLIVVVDRDYAGDDARWITLLEACGRAALDRPIAIQVRAKETTPEQAAALGARARAAVPAGVTLLLNGEAALAERLGYTGVHWPDADIPAAPPPHALAVRSAAVHTIEATQRAERAGADIALFGSVYAPGSHPGDGVGIAPLRAVAQATSLPVFAIGGIQPEHVADCLDAGAAGVAVVSGILGAPDIAAAIDRYLRAIDEARTEIANECTGRTRA